MTENEINFENMPPALKFYFVSLMKTALYFKQLECEKNTFLDFCEEIWASMEMTPADELEEALNELMKHDISRFMKKMNRGMTTIRSK